MKKVLFRVIAVAVVAALGWGGYRLVKSLPSRQRDVATTRVRRGDVTVRTYSRGELQAVRQITLTAPNLFGTVQVTRLAPLGAFAREGDLIVEFDDAEVLSRLEEKQLELDQIEERIRKSEADLAIRNNQDEVELLRARYTVRRAELEVQRNELLSQIDATKNTLNLEEARRRLEKLKSDIQSRRAQAEAELAVLRENRRKAELEMQRERQRLRDVKLLSPMSGLVAIRQARSHFFFSGMQLPDIREGDELRPGMPVADILDLSELQVTARVGELDRANLTEGQPVTIRLDALPQKELQGKIKSLSGTASADVYSNDPAKKFDVTFEIDMRDLLEALGARPEQIARILQTAEQNRNRAPARNSAAPMVLAMAGGGFGGGGAPDGGPGFGGAAGAFPGAGGAGGFAGAQGGGSAGGFPGSGAAAGGRRPGGGFANVDPTQLLDKLPDEQQKKARDLLDKEMGKSKWPDLSEDKKREILRALRPMLREAFAAARGGANGGRSGGPSDEQLKNAKLPPPPEEDSQLDVLLRPGVLADVEIVIEHIPDALHIPAQSVFERDGKPIVYVKRGERFEERAIKLSKRSENTIVIAEGLQEGEILALADPTAKPGAARREPAAPANGSPMQNFGGGGRGQ